MRKGKRKSLSLFSCNLHLKSQEIKINGEIYHAYESKEYGRNVCSSQTDI